MTVSTATQRRLVDRRMRSPWPCSPSSHAVPAAPALGALFEPVVACCDPGPAGCCARATPRRRASPRACATVAPSCSRAAWSCGLASAPLQGMFRLRATCGRPSRASPPPPKAPGWLEATSGRVDEDEPGSACLASGDLQRPRRRRCGRRGRRARPAGALRRLHAGFSRARGATVRARGRLGAGGGASPRSAWSRPSSPSCTPLVLTGGHVLGELKDAVVNHAGFPSVARDAPSTPGLFELQAAVRAHRHVRPVGGRHSERAHAPRGRRRGHGARAHGRSMVYEPATQQLRAGGGGSSPSAQLVMENRMPSRAGTRTCRWGRHRDGRSTGWASSSCRGQLADRQRLAVDARRGDPEFEYAFGSCCSA